VYGLGAMLFELLAGERPFRAGDEDRSAPLSARYPQLAEGPNLGALAARGVPEALTSVIGRCLARDPLARFRTAAELLRALDEFTPVKIYPEHLTPGAALLPPASGAAAAG
jgi:serine/threonine-protein kinase